MESLLNAIDAARLGLAELDTARNFVAVNAAYLNMLGLDEEELLGRSWSATIHPEDHDLADAAYELARREGRGYVEIRAIRADSTIAYQGLTITRIDDEHGAFQGYACLRLDISAFKQKQEGLRLAVESTPNGRLMLSSIGIIQSVNRAVETLFGYSRSQLIGCPVETLLPEGFRDRQIRDLEAFAGSESTKRTVGRDLRGTRRDGVEIPMQVFLNRIETDGGELILCTVIDIAERVRYGQQLELANQAAEAANHAKSDFLARMSHEIPTPMNLIMGMNALLLESPLNDQQRQHVEISYRNVRRLLRLGNGILDLSKVESGKLTLNTAPFYLNEVLGECAAKAASAIEQKGLQFEMSIDAGAWHYWTGDAERLQQVLLNLIGNAVKFTASGKIEVRVFAERVPEGENGLRFEVIDSGWGVPAEKSAMIFDAFQQGEGSVDRPFEGTGLGLAIAKSLAGMMAGEIWLEQTPNPGCKFVFTAFFQVATNHNVNGATTAASVKIVRTVEPGTRILLVEDNPENMILIRAYLNSLSLAIDFASNGLEAVEKRRDSSYDLILMDIQMPVMDGYTATREIRAGEITKELPRVPIVALTAHALTGSSGDSMEAGCDEHLTKPVERADLIETIARFAKTPDSPAEDLPEGIAALRPAYLANRAADLERLRKAMAANDFNTIRAIGHNCKGTGKGYGFPALSEAGAAIERSAKAFDMAGLEESICHFDRVLRASSLLPEGAAAA